MGGVDLCDRMFIDQSPQHGFSIKEVASSSDHAHRGAVDITLNNSWVEYKLEQLATNLQFYDFMVAVGLHLVQSQS